MNLVGISFILRNDRGDEDSCRKHNEVEFMNQITIRDEFIKLGQALKLAGIAQSGVDAKYMIEEGNVKVNGETETRRGKKLYDGDTVEAEGKSFTVSSSMKN